MSRLVDSKLNILTSLQNLPEKLRPLRQDFSPRLVRSARGKELARLSTSVREPEPPLAAMNIQGTVMFLVMAAGALAGCGDFSKTQQATSDPNLPPTNYRSTLTAFLSRSLTNKSDFRGGAMISEPALKPVGSSQHYVACVQFNPQSANKTKVAIYLSGKMTQFVDATPEQCADAAYQPFKELDAAGPSGPSRQDILNDPRGTH